MAAPPVWDATTPAEPHEIGLEGWLRIVPKALAMGFVTFGCLAILLLVRLVERPLNGLYRPWTPYITQFVCRTNLALMGLQHRHSGTPMKEHGAMVANHTSWLDIFVLNAEARIYFVSKSEVASWPGIGWLARATGTVFIRRDPREAKRQVADIEARLEAGHQLLFFPEGTSTDGLRVLPFRSTLFQPFVQGDDLRIQPVTVVYHAPGGREPRFYGWWGDMDFGGNLLKLLAAPRHGRVEVIYHPPLEVAAAGGRKALASETGQIIRATLARRLGRDPSDR